MSPYELRRAVTSFRRGILGRRSSRSMCFAVCAPLQGWLSCCGLETDMMEADFGKTNHVWLRLATDEIIDPTADQFDLVPVYIGPWPAVYQRMMVGEAWKSNR